MGQLWQVGRTTLLPVTWYHYDIRWLTGGLTVGHLTTSSWSTLQALGSQFLRDWHHAFLIVNNLSLASNSAGELKPAFPWQLGVHLQLHFCFPHTWHHIQGEITSCATGWKFPTCGAKIMYIDGEPTIANFSIKVFIKLGYFSTGRRRMEGTVGDLLQSTNLSKRTSVYVTWTL